MGHRDTGANDAVLHAGRSWWLLLLMGLLAVVFGVLAIFHPVATGAGLTWAMGVLALIEGGLTVLALLRKDSALSVGWSWAYAIFSLLFGVLAVLNPISMAASLVTVAGVWVLVAGAVRIVLALRVRQHGWTLLLSGILAVVLGGLMVWIPVASLVMAVVWMGVAALAVGLLQIFAALRLRRVAH